MFTVKRRNVTYNDRIILYLDITSIDVRVTSPRPLFAREKRIENEYKQRYYVEICWLEESTRVLFLCTFFFPRENFMKNRKRRTGPKIRLVHEFLKNDESKNI